MIYISWFLQLLLRNDKLLARLESAKKDRTWEDNILVLHVVSSLLLRL